MCRYPLRTFFGMVILVIAGSCLQVEAAPVISSLSVTAGVSGTSVTITGSGFGSTKGTSTVAFGGVVAQTNSWTSTSIVAVVPSGPSGLVNVQVTVSNVGSNAMSFIAGTNPAISSLSENSAPVDDEVTVFGANFGSTQGSSTVTFNGIQAIPSSWSSTSISAIVPNGATTGKISVTVNGIASNGIAFMVTPPQQQGGVGFVQGTYSDTGGQCTLVGAQYSTQFLIALPLDVQTGNLIVVVASFQELNSGSTDVQVVGDQLNNSFLYATSTISGTKRQKTLYASNIIGGPDVIIAQLNSSKGCVATPEVRIAEFKGLATSGNYGYPLDVSSTTLSSSGTTCNSGSKTTTNQNDLLIGANLAGQTTTAPGTNYTNRVITTPDGNILEDRIVTAIGSYSATATMATSGSCLMDMVAFKVAPNQAPIVDAGPSQTIVQPTNTVTLDGGVTDDGLPNNTLTVSWSKLSGPGTVTFTSQNTANTQATFSTYGTYVLQLSASDSQLTTNSSVTITVNSEPISLSLALSAPLAGPDVTGTSQTVTALLKDGTGATAIPKPNASVQFTVSGSNARTGSATTDSTGTATFSYTGSNSGNDTVQASYTGQNSNSVSVSWLVPRQTISTTPILGRFFTSDGFAGFDTLPTATPVFSLIVPNIAFNPPSGSIPGNTSGVDIGSRPFTDVTTDMNGNFNGTIVAQGNGLQAGVGSLVQFQAVFTGSFTVATAGNVSLSFYSDDAFVLGIGNGATRVSGPMNNIPASGYTPFTNLPAVGGNFLYSATIVVNFPAPGSYPYELDYSECCSGPLSITMLYGQSTTFGFPPSGSLSLTPLTPASQSTGQNQTFSVLATDATGAPLANTTVTLYVNGANQRQLTATTNSSGQATFQYAGTNAGKDTVQAATLISGMGQYSNQVGMNWTVAAGSGAITFVPQGWIASPFNGATIQAQAPVTLITGENLASGTLTYWPTSNPGAVSTLNSNTTTTSGGTLGTFDATVVPSGGYTIQLNATDTNNNTQVSQVTVSVVGNNKPGRMKSTVTEFTVPLAGIPITITRTYDSLERNQIEDFGYGWKLGTTVSLTVDSKLNVTFNFNGQRQTFYFQPQPSSPWFAWLQVPQYIPQPGLHGSLISDGCGSVINVQGAWNCFGTGTYQPTLYAYTDPMGRTYTITSGGQLQSIQDLDGNKLTVTLNGITSSVNGIVIPFVRDPNTGNITKITDLNGNDYTYSYDGSGNLLQSVQYPGLTAAETYTYFPDHSLHTETDPRGNTSTATYYTDGRLQSISDTMQPPNVWNYSYNLMTNTTTTTNPDGGTVTRTDDSFGNPLSITEQVNTTTNRTTTYQYDAKENLLTMIDACGNGTCADTTGTNHTTTYTYDANGFQTSVQDPLGHKSTKTYNSYGGVLTATDAANTNTQTTTYYANFNPQQTTDLLNGAGTQVSSYTFDALGDMLTYTDANGKTMQNAYDPNGNLIQATDALNQVTHYSYDAMDRLLLQTDPMGNSTQFTYDGLGHLKTKTDAQHHVTNYFYDNNGNKTSETDANHYTTNYQYDNMNHLKLVTYPDTTTKQYTYDFRGNKLTEIDQSGHTTKYVYDLAGELTSVTSAYGTTDAGTVTYSYDLDGRQATVADELNNPTTNTYDAAGRLTTVKDALTNSTNYGYDADNRKASVQDANLNTTTYAYDARGRLATITYPIVPPAPQPTTTAYTYDGMGRLLTTTDQAGKVTTKTYDDVGRLSTVKDAILPTGNVTHYFYDLNGNLRFLQDAAGRVTSYQYDTLNRRALRALPLNQSESYTYDPVGNLATKTDFNSLLTTYNYDNLNRLLSKVPDPTSNQPTVSFTYTPTGQRLSMTDASGTTNYPTYDNRDRLKNKATPEGTLNYTYDAHGNLLTLVSSNTNGASLAYTYDVLNRLSKVCDNRIAPNCGAAGTTTYSYDAVGNLAGYAYPNTIQTANVFDTQSRLTKTCEATSSPACSASQKLASYTYTLGNAGNRTNVAELSGRSLVYGYDNDYRLQSETITSDPGGNNGAESYTYDAVGNRQTLTSTIPSLPGSMTYSYDANDRLTTDAYDNNGNTISSGGTANTYDFENRMLTHGAVSIVYDGDGNRVSETVGGTTTKFLLDDHNPTSLPQMLDELVNGSVTRTYAYGYQRISENQQINGTWTPRFYGYDGHWNTRFLSSSVGTVTDSYDYDAFGMPIRTSGTTPNQFLYSEERNDSNVGLYDLRARYYNQATGRFWERDAVEGYPCLPPTLHPYVYAWDDPVNRIDPTGNLAVETVRLDEFAVARGIALAALALGLICEYNADGTGVSAVAQPDVLGGPQTVYRAGRCTISSKRNKSKTCTQAFPNAIRCDALPPDYKYNNAAQGIGAIGAYWGRPVGEKNKTASQKGPCGVNGSGVLAGTHYSLMFLDGSKRPYPGSIGCCPCCDESGGLPRLAERCACLNVDHKTCPF